MYRSCTSLPLSITLKNPGSRIDVRLTKTVVICGVHIFLHTKREEHAIAIR